MLKIQMIPRFPKRNKKDDKFIVLCILASVVIALLLILTGEIVRQGARVNNLNKTIMELQIGNH